MKKLGIIGGGVMAGIFAINAREMGIETHCFSPSNGIIDKTLFDYIHNVNIIELNSLLEMCKKANIDGVVATTELTIAPTAYIAEKLNLIGIPYLDAIKITDKYRNRKVTQNIKELYHPKYNVVYSVEDIISLNYNYPVILKPTSKGGKRGITVIKSEKDIQKAYDYAVKETNNSLPFILEEFIDGEIECSVESLSYKGNNYIIQVTEKITSGPPHCVELAHHQPADISINLREKIENVIDKGLTSIGVTNGACHTEIKISNNKIYLIEFNARPGGDHIAYPLTELSTGYPYIKGAINIALNKFVPIEKDKLINKYAGVVFITEQTKKFKKLFDTCENYKWCYKKNFISNELDEIVHNDGFNKNYFIYYSDNILEFLKEKK